MAILASATQRLGGGPVDRFHSDCECPFTADAICFRSQKTRGTAGIERPAKEHLACLALFLLSAPAGMYVTTCQGPDSPPFFCRLRCAAAQAGRPSCSPPHMLRRAPRRRSPDAGAGSPYRCLFGHVTPACRHGEPGAAADWPRCGAALGIHRRLAGLVACPAASGRRVAGSETASHESRLALGRDAAAATFVDAACQ